MFQKINKKKLKIVEFTLLKIFNIKDEVNQLALVFENKILTCSQ